jgi:DNA polymerase-3 subunit delta'
MPWPIIGHAWAVTLLQQGLDCGRVSHAYLFCGPPQIGKTTLALTLAQALNCSQDDRPCGQCPSCLKIAGGTHPDVQVVVGKGVGGGIQIDQIRALQREVALAPYMGRYRVVILRQMDQATPEAANSLLKTLEEPPPHVVLILTAAHRTGLRPTLVSRAVRGSYLHPPEPADDRTGLPPTLVSRCQCLDLRPVPLHVAEAALAERGHTAEQARLLARLSGGRVGWAISAGRDAAILRQRRQDLDQLLELLPAGRLERLDGAPKLGRDPMAARRLMAVWATWWRDVLLTCSGHPDHAVNVDHAERLAALAGRLSLYQAWAVLAAVQECSEQLQDNVNPRLALEGLFLRLPTLNPGIPTGPQ